MRSVRELPLCNRIRLCLLEPRHNHGRDLLANTTLQGLTFEEARALLARHDLIHAPKWIVARASRYGTRCRAMSTEQDALRAMRMALAAMT